MARHRKQMEITTSKRRASDAGEIDTAKRFRHTTRTDTVPEPMTFADFELADYHNSHDVPMSSDQPLDISTWTASGYALFENEGAPAVTVDLDANHLVPEVHNDSGIGVHSCNANANLVCFGMVSNLVTFCVFEKAELKVLHA